MCIIILEDKQGHIDITQTKIFARHTSNEHQLIVYSMAMQTNSAAVMILPIPIKAGSGEEAVRFIDMRSSPNKNQDILSSPAKGFFSLLEEICQPECPDYSHSALNNNESFFDTFSNNYSEKTLKVHEVGDYKASYIPTKENFKQLDSQFQLKTEIWDKLPDYSDYGFIVFKLKTSLDLKIQTEIPPMAFEFPTAYSERLFFPTIHLHSNNDQEDLTLGNFDHLLYCQREDARAEFKYQRDLLKQQTPTSAQKGVIIHQGSDDLFKKSHSELNGYPWFLSSINSPFSITNDIHKGVIDPNKEIFAMNIEGQYKNKDIWLGEKLPTIDNEIVFHHESIKKSKKPLLILSTNNVFDLVFIAKENEDSISIGREVGNTWILPDQKKYISGKHAIIKFIDGEYILTDISTNGVFINNAKKSLGNGNSITLNNNDLLFMAYYTIKVVISKPAIEKDTIDEALIETQIAIKKPNLLFPKEKQENIETPLELEETKINPISIPENNILNSTDPIQQFLKGAGISDNITQTRIAKNINPEALGKLFQIAIKGTIDLLHSRAEIKNEIRMDATLVKATKNNPLKFSISLEDTLLRLMEAQKEDYMEPKEALTEAYKDMKAHQIAMMAGIQSTVSTLLDHFEPDKLTKRLEQENPIIDNIPIYRKAKLWKQFEKLYATIQQEAEEDFNRLLGTEFNKAYQKQVKQLKYFNKNNSN